MSEQYFINSDTFPSIYLGIIIQNNDPSRKGRVKVYVPEISPAVYDGWNDVRDGELKFKFFGKNIDSDITPILNDLRTILPWSLCVMPIIGDNAPGKFDATSEIATISDAPGHTSDESEETRLKNVEEDKGELNYDGVGEAPGHLLERQSTRIDDLLNNPEPFHNIDPNVRGKSIIPTTHSNRSKGSFSIPSVGAHVWVQFRNGNPQFPVVVGSAPGGADYEELFECYAEDEAENRYRHGGIDYPGWLQNKKGSREDHEVSEDTTFRSKWILNQRGGSIEIVNTDNREKIKFTHWTGSFAEMGNTCNTNYSARDHQDIIGGSRWITVRGENSTNVQGNSDDTVIAGDRYIKTGNINDTSLLAMWKEIVAPLQGALSLFHIKRTNQKAIKPAGVSYTDDDLKYEQKMKGQFQSHGALSATVTGNNNNLVLDRSIVLTVDSISSGVSKFTMAENPGLQDGAIVRSAISDSKSGKAILGDRIGPFWPGSPSTQGGRWDSENVKDKIKDIRASVQKALTLVECGMSAGGDKFETITRNSTTIYGGAFNDFPAVRIDPIGRAYNDSMVMSSTGAFPNYYSGAHLEPIPIERMPGGTKTEVIGDSWNVNIGANGFNINTIGIGTLSSAILNISTRELNISCDSNVHVMSNVMSLRGNIVEISNTSPGGQVYVGSSLGVYGNTVMGGSLAVNGELYVQHITAPAELQETERTVVSGQFNCTEPRKLIIGEVEVSEGVFSPVYALPNPDLLYVYNHSHNFINIPFRPLNSTDETRSTAILEGINPGGSVNPIGAFPLHHGLKAWDNKAVDVAVIPKNNDK